MRDLATLIELPAVRAILASDLEASALGVERSCTLPPGCYTDPDFYAFELEAVFAREWLCLGRVEQVPSVGDWFSVTIADEPMIVVRSAPDDVRVLSAVCQHRGMVITAPSESTPDEWGRLPPETAGHGRQLRCPYHYWVYDLEGRLIGAPEMQRTCGFDKADVRLPRIRSEIWNGFVFANLDPDAEPLAPRLADLSALLANWHLDEMVSGPPQRLDDLPWNWKVMQENGLENYHSDRLHRGLHDAVPSSGLLPTPYDDGSAAIISRLRASHRDFSLNPTYKALLPIIPTLTDEERETSTFALLPPTLLIGMNTDSALYRIVMPTAVDRITIVFGNLFPPGERDERRFREVQKMVTAGLLTMTSQDVPTDAAVQKGLRSRFAPRGRYSWQEEPLAHFNRWLVRRYRKAAS